MIGVLSVISFVSIGQVNEPIAMRDAWKDLKSLSTVDRTYVRYLVRPNSWDDKTWEKFRPALVGHLNHLTKSAIFYNRPPFIKNVGNHLLRIDTFRFGWTDVWDTQVDPYLVSPFVEKVQVWPGGIYPGDGKHYPAGAFRERWRENVLSPAIILMENDDDAVKMNEIIYWTGSQHAALVRADWWMNQTIASDNRKVGYPEFLRFKDMDEWEALIGFDKKKAEGFRFELREAVSKSGVTLHARAFARYDALGGAYWKSLDFLNPTGLDHPLRLPGRNIENAADAFETYGVLPNGLPAMGAFNKQRKLQRAVPGNVATDDRSLSRDHQVHLAVSCIRCHTEGALQDLDGFFRKAFVPPLKAVVEEYDYEKAIKIQEELEQQYLRSIKTAIVKDRLAYDAAIKECVGLDYKSYSKLIAEAWTKYEDAAVNTAYAAREFGMTEKEFRDRLAAAIAGGYKVEPTIGVLRQEGERAVTIGIREWEEIHGSVWNVIRGVELKK